MVGVVSDTHGLLRPEIAAAFAGVSLILHAGDVGGPKVLAALSAIAPVEAVFGNVDDVHDPSLARERVYRGDVVIFGHTHKAVVVRDGDRVACNPGAAGPRRFDVKPSVARLTITSGDPRVIEVEIISLG